jgi:hypothetical protein
MCDDQANIRSDRIILTNRRQVRVRELPADHLRERKLPPEPGRTPRFTTVPEDEILPPGKRPQGKS